MIEGALALAKDTYAATSMMEASKMSSPNVLVCGAGLAGLSLALGIAALGIHVDVIEVRKDILAATGSAFSLAVAGIKALDQICSAVLKPIYEKGILMSDGSYGLPWWVVRNALLDEAKKSDLITFHMDAKVQEIIEEASTVRVKYSNEKGIDCELKGSLLVGCDGVHSVIRKHLGLPPAQAVKDTWRGFVKISENDTILAPLLQQGLAPILYHPFGSGSSFTLFNFHQSLPGIMCWQAITDVNNPQGENLPDILKTHLPDDDKYKKTIEEIFKLSKESDLQRVVKMCVINPEDHATSSTGWGGRGRVTLAGDAAHSQRGALGLGGSMAFEDSVILVREIAAAGNNIDETVVSRFEQNRLPRVTRIWKKSWEQAEYFYKFNKRSPPPDEEFLKWVSAGV